MASSADFAELASSAVTAEVASSADPVSLVDPYETFGVGDDNNSLAPQGCIVDCSNLAEVAFLDDHDVGGLAEVMPPSAMESFAVAAMSCREHVRVVISHWRVSVFHRRIPKSSLLLL